MKSWRCLKCFAAGNLPERSLDLLSSCNYNLIIYFLSSKTFTNESLSLPISVPLKPVIVLNMNIYPPFLRLVKFLFLTGVRFQFCTHFWCMAFAPFCPSVLEPNFDLTFCHSEGVSQSCPLRPCQIFGLFKGFFKGEDLMATKCRSSVLSFVVCVPFATDWMILSC